MADGKVTSIEAARAQLDAEATAAAHERAPPRDMEDGQARVLQTVALSTIAAKPIVPLWPGALYVGKVTVVAGIPGDGKSLGAVDIAARISTGGRWPNGDGGFQEGRSLLLTAEDDPADTIRPRFDVAGGNATLLEIVQGVATRDQDGNPVLDTVSLLSDLDMIERRVTELAITLLIIDPLTSFSSGTDTNKTGDMRALLDRLAQMAARTGVAILVITHLNKRSDARKALQLVAGSHVIVAAVRCVLVTARDPNEKNRRLLLPIKLNIARDDGGFAFRIEVERHRVAGEIPRVEWEAGRVLDMTADEALIDSTPRAQAAVEKANEVQDWVRDLLRIEPVLAATMWRQAKEKGFNERRVRNALKALHARCELMGYQGRWHYRLPESDGKAPCS